MPGDRRNLPAVSHAARDRPDPTAKVGPLPLVIIRLRCSASGTAACALSAVCPHKGGPIADGQIDNKSYSARSI